MNRQYILDRNNRMYSIRKNNTYDKFTLISNSCNARKNSKKYDLLYMICNKT